MFLTEEKFFALEIAEQFRATAEMMKNNPVADVPESSLVTEVREKAESEGPTETQIVELVLQLKKYEFVFVEKNLAEQSYYDRLSKMVKMMPGYGT